MKTIRLGNDINVSWIITRNGEAEDFSSKDVKVYLYDTSTMLNKSLNIPLREILLMVHSMEKTNQLMEFIDFA